MFHSSVALLPSSACMYAVLFGYWAWFSDRLLLGLVFGSFGVLLCWPFVGVMFVPMGLHALYSRGFAKVLLCAIYCSTVFIGVPALLDTFLYGKPTFAIINLVLYNVAGQGGGGQGANLYGTEPWYFYFQNLALNFNAVAALGLVAPLLVLCFWGFRVGSKEKTSDGKLHTSRWLVLGYIVPMLATLSFFTMADHKEERFLSMTYPMICFCAALSIDIMDRTVQYFVGGAFLTLERLLIVLGVFACCVLSVSRSTGLHMNFYAPIEVFEHVNQLDQLDADLAGATVCLGKEWYRFPSSFFLPQGVSVHWTKSAFDGQLPQPFSPWPEGTKKVHSYFNDENRGDPTRFFDVSKCDYAVDLNVGTDFGAIGRWDEMWSRKHCASFLDANLSPAFIRSFYIPFGYSAKKNVYAEYCLLEKNSRV
mmetsp:Transcript_12705/g.22943  ORF Transcript_12705/g.22943 Transcript_12705/m.22943 type:complete len:421 (+) Transcript_12705:588-1850(+)